MTSAARACPHCGMPVEDLPVAGTRTVVVSRVKRFWIGVRGSDGDSLREQSQYDPSTRKYVEHVEVCPK